MQTGFSNLQGNSKSHTSLKLEEKLTKEDDVIAAIETQHEGISMPRPVYKLQFTDANQSDIFKENVASQIYFSSTDSSESAGKKQKRMLESSKVSFISSSCMLRLNVSI